MAHTSRPPLDALATVLAVARHASFTAAASDLGVTHGAVSRRVAGVEAWLGQALFERHGRGVRPTPDGQRFLGRVEDAFGLIDGAADRWRRRRGPEVVRLSVVPSLAKLWLFERLAALEAGDGTGPALRVEVAVEHRHADLEAGQADLAVRYGRGTWRGLDARPLLPECLVPFARVDIAARLGPEPDAGAILGWPLLHDSDASGWRSWLDQARGTSVKPRPGDRRFEDYTLVLAAARAGLGLALARLPLAGPYLGAHPELVRISGSTVAGPLAHHLLSRPREDRPAVLALAGRLIAAAGEGD